MNKRCREFTHLTARSVKNLPHNHSTHSGLTQEGEFHGCVVAQVVFVCQVGNSLIRFQGHTE